jgi:large subunit ribosomal protein L30
MTTLVIRQHKSTIGEKKAARETLASLGLKRPGNVVERPDTPALRGQLRKIAHLVDVEPKAEGRQEKRT